MLKKLALAFASLAMALIFVHCGGKKNNDNNDIKSDTTQKNTMMTNLQKYDSFELKTDMTSFSENDKDLLRKLFDAAQIMEEIYWIETFGDKNQLLDSIKDDATKRFALINFGPWDRLDDNKPFIEKYGVKPAGANFYPKDMTKEEFEKWENPAKKDLYTMIRRDEKGALTAIPYHEFFKNQIAKAAELIKQAAELADDAGFKNYLNLRAEALLTDDYRPSDMAWLDMKSNRFDFVVGPIETYEDALFGFKASHEAFILVKDMEWSQRLEKYTALLPKLQEMLPVETKYKAQVPGSSGNELNAYDVLFYAGDCNAGSKTIAINLPNDEVVHAEKGSRKLQLKNAMKAKFDKILVPIANILIDESQRKNVTFDAFFANTMFHEVGHGLGMNYLINDNTKTVREALENQYTSIEEGKADILGLFIVDQLYEMGELGKVDLMDYYVTFFAGIFRSSRFGAASAHGKANMMRFYYFEEKGAFTRNAENGTYKVNFEKMREAMKSLAEKILVIQGNGDIQTAKTWIEKDGIVREQLQKDLDKVNQANIAVDIVFIQGKEVLGL